MRSPDTAPPARRLPTVLRRVVGRPSDWHLRRPRFRLPTWTRAWIGPILVAASVAIGWPAFAGAQGEDGNVAFGLFVGATSIVLMAWSFVLALRPKVLEPIFGGLDSMYRVHRWAGTLAVVAMFLHTRAEPEIEGGIRGASGSLADSAEELAGTGELMLYALVAISLLRWFPYRWWRWTHKLLGIPFAFACFHFFTAEKPYANSSPWGWYFGAIMVAGLVAYVLRVVGRDVVAQGLRYRVSSVERSGSTTALSLAPVGRRLDFRPGQFAVFKIQAPGLREPHPFTIASSPGDDELRFHVRHLGDWSARVQAADLLGSKVRVEGPYGEFAPFPSEPAPTYWVAGGVGITPFLSAIDTLAPATGADRPTLLYCVRDRTDATARAEVERAAADGRIRLEWFESRRGRRFTADGLAEVAGGAMHGAHVALCGPVDLVHDAAAAARGLGAASIETEDFDIRSGFGPDLSEDIDRLVTGLTR